MNRQLHRRFHPDPRSKLALFVAACLCVFSGMTRMQEIVLLLLCIIVLLLCKKAGRAVVVVLMFLLMTLGDQLLVSRLSGMAQYAALLTCHVLRFLLPLAVSFYLVTKTVTVGAYISAFTAMRLPGVVVIPMRGWEAAIPDLFPVGRSSGCLWVSPWPAAAGSCSMMSPPADRTEKICYALRSKSQAQIRMRYVP